MKFWKKILQMLLLLTVGYTAQAQKDPDVGNVLMSTKKTVLQNLTASPVHKTLVSELAAAGLDDTFNGKGPYTIFAPTDDAFDLYNRTPRSGSNPLPAPIPKPISVKMLNYFAVPGKLSTKQLRKLVKRGNGTATLTTLEGGRITVKNSGEVYTLTDEKGRSAVIITADVISKNGMVQVTDFVLAPN